LHFLLPTTSKARIARFSLAFKATSTSYRNRLLAYKRAAHPPSTLDRPSPPAPSTGSSSTTRLPFSSASLLPNSHSKEQSYDSRRDHSPHTGMIASSTQSHVKQSAIFRPDSGPLLLDQNTRQNFTQLPPIQNVLPSVAQPDAIQRPRGSTLPSYNSPRTDHLSAPTNDSHLRSSRKDRSMTIGGRSRDAANVSLGDDGPAQGTSGISLPPIRLSKDSPPAGPFRGLPPIKAMLPSPSHMISMDSKSPTSPQSSQSLGPLSTSWSSHAYTSASSADIAGRFPREWSPVYNGSWATNPISEPPYLKNQVI
jgi:hypothetical protein